MSDSCDFCDDFTPTPAGVPGPAGTPGATGGVGPTGPTGPAAYTTLSAGFTMPAFGADVQIQVGTTDWMGADLHIFVGGAGYFSVVSVDSSLLATITPQDVNANANAGSAIPLGGVVIPAGVAFVDTSVTDDLDNRITAVEGAGTGTTTYYSASEPTGPGLIVGDLWFDTDDGNKLYRWDGASWVDVGRVLEQEDFGLSVSAVGIGTTFPVSPKTGEFFYKSDEDKLYRWNGSAWTSAVSTGDLVGTVDGSTFIIDGTIVASKIGAAEINSTHVGSNLLITNTANIGDATITDAKISNVNAGKIVTGDMVAVNIAHEGFLYNPNDGKSDSNRNYFKSTEFNTSSGSSQIFTTGTAFGFSGPGPLKAYCPAHPSWGASGSIKASPDADGKIRAQVQGRLLGYTGLITVYYRKNGTGSFVAIGSRNSADGNDAILDAIRILPDTFTETDYIDFYVAPCDGNGDIATQVTCRYELDVTIFNW